MRPTDQQILVSGMSIPAWEMASGPPNLMRDHAAALCADPSALRVTVFTP